MLLLAWRYNSGTILAFSTIPFHLRRSWTCSVHFMSFMFFRSFLTSSSHRGLGSSYWSSCECFPFAYFLYNTSFRQSIYVSKPTQSLGFNPFQPRDAIWHHAFHLFLIYACLLPIGSSSHLSTLRWLFRVWLAMLIRTKRPVLACFVGAAASACDGGVH